VALSDEFCLNPIKVFLSQVTLIQGIANVATRKCSACLTKLFLLNIQRVGELPWLSMGENVQKR